MQGPPGHKASFSSHGHLLKTKLRRSRCLGLLLLAFARRRRSNEAWHPSAARRRPPGRGRLHSLLAPDAAAARAPSGVATGGELRAQRRVAAAITVGRAAREADRRRARRYAKHGVEDRRAGCGAIRHSCHSYKIKKTHHRCKFGTDRTDWGGGTRRAREHEARDRARQGRG